MTSRSLITALALLLCSHLLHARTLINIDKGWKTHLVEKEKQPNPVEVDLPHNWDDYYGYRQLLHGNLHGTAIYQKELKINDLGRNKSYFLRFDGVGTYCTLSINGHTFEKEPIGRTTYTYDITPYIHPGKANKITVEVAHPEMILDMPWVCGGCSSEWGFSEGSQPLGIFRSVWLEVTDNVRIEPFGVHVWNDQTATRIHLSTDVHNYQNTSATVELISQIFDPQGKEITTLRQSATLAVGETQQIKAETPITSPQYWDLGNPCLYKVVTTLRRNGKESDREETPFGIRTLSWPVKRNNGDQRFFLNNKPVFLNGVCEYEHQFGQSHAFSVEQVAARVKQIRAAGFNAFRDAHQPHHLLYNQLFDRYGILDWTQFSAHVWYDTPEFRNNFKKLLRRWVRERRNSPSIIIWGLQNESTLPSAFAEECSAIIREMDPTAEWGRIITTCNGGEGTDWNVVQNWSGTYGGKPENYAAELKQPTQLLNGEYGAWRSIDLHTEPAPFEQNGTWSEDRMNHLMGTKIRLAESVRDSVCGQFQWIYSSHDNPGRRQPDEAYRLIDKVGPFNYKGLVSPWEEPLDVYYMYRASYVDPSIEPMVYIVSHTWPDRFTSRRRATIEVYSNCDSVRLYNDATDHNTLGVKRRGSIGSPFVWEHRDIRYNTLRAVGYVGGKPVATDIILLNNLEKAPHFDTLYADNTPILRGEKGYNYLYRVNCGGDTYIDEFDQMWLKDNTLFSSSWAKRFDKLSPFQASQRTTNDPIRHTRDWSLFGHFRFGRHELSYHFPLPDGKYRVELYFVEPWHGTGGGGKTDCAGLRLFDVAINGETRIKDLDLWAEAGHDIAIKRIVDATVKDGMLTISFPKVKAGQAIISAIAIAAKEGKTSTPSLIEYIRTQANSSTFSWEEADQQRLAKTPLSDLPEEAPARETRNYTAQNAKKTGAMQLVEQNKRQGIRFDKADNNKITFEIQTGLAQIYVLRFRYINSPSESARNVRLRMTDSQGTILKDDQLSFPPTAEKWKLVSTTTGGYINAGTYFVELSGNDLESLLIESLDVQ